MSRQLLCTSHRTFVREKFTKNTKKIFSPELWTHNQQETTFSYLTSAHAKHVRLNVNKQQNNCSIFKVEWIIAHQLSLHGLVHCEVRWLCIEGLREFPIEFVRLIKLLNLLNIFFCHLYHSGILRKQFWLLQITYCLCFSAKNWRFIGFPLQVWLAFFLRVIITRTPNGNYIHKKYPNHRSLDQKCIAKNVYLLKN